MGCKILTFSLWVGFAHLVLAMIFQIFHSKFVIHEHAKTGVSGDERGERKNTTSSKPNRCLLLNIELAMKLFKVS